MIILLLDRFEQFWHVEIVEVDSMEIEPHRTERHGARGVDGCVVDDDGTPGLEHCHARRADRASTEKFQAALRHIPDVDPEEHDRF